MWPLQDRPQEIAGVLRLPVDVTAQDLVLHLLGHHDVPLQVVGEHHGHVATRSRLEDQVLGFAPTDVVVMHPDHVFNDVVPCRRVSYR
jgi:hypothetical protein